MYKDQNIRSPSPRERAFCAESRTRRSETVNPCAINLTPVLSGAHIPSMTKGLIGRESSICHCEVRGACTHPLLIPHPNSRGSGLTYFSTGIQGGQAGSLSKRSRKARLHQSSARRSYCSPGTCGSGRGPPPDRPWIAYAGRSSNRQNSGATVTALRPSGVPRRTYARRRTPGSDGRTPRSRLTGPAIGPARTGLPDTRLLPPLRLAERRGIVSANWAVTPSDGRPRPPGTRPSLAPDRRAARREGVRAEAVQERVSLGRLC